MTDIPDYVQAAIDAKNAAWKRYNEMIERGQYISGALDAANEASRKYYAADARWNAEIAAKLAAQECACVTPGQHCPACEQAARVAAGDEFPY